MRIVHVGVTAVVVGLVGGIVATVLHDRNMDRRPATSHRATPASSEGSTADSPAADDVADSPANGWVVVSPDVASTDARKPPPPPAKPLRAAATEMLLPLAHCQTLLTQAGTMPLVDADSAEGKEELVRLKETASVARCLKP